MEAEVAEAPEEVLETKLEDAAPAEAETEEVRKRGGSAGGVFIIIDARRDANVVRMAGGSLSSSAAAAAAAEREDEEGGDNISDNAASSSARPRTIRAACAALDSARIRRTAISGFGVVSIIRLGKKLVGREAAVVAAFVMAVVAVVAMVGESLAMEYVGTSVVEGRWVASSVVGFTVMVMVVAGVSMVAVATSSERTRVGAEEKTLRSAVEREA